MTAKNSQARISANARYNIKNYDVISFRVNKSENLNSKIDDAVKAIQAATGDKDYSKAKFMLDAIRAKLDGPQPVQEPPQPVATPATAPATAPEGVPEGYTVIPVCLPATIVNSIDKACSAGYGPARDPYIISAVNVQLRRDADTEKEKRRQAAIDRMYAELPPD